MKLTVELHDDGTVVIPPEADALQLLRIAREADQEAEKRRCHSRVGADTPAGAPVGRCHARHGHDGPHWTWGAANHSDTAQLQQVRVEWHTRKAEA